MKPVYYDQISDLERRMDDLMRSLWRPTLRSNSPVRPLFSEEPFVPVTDVFVRGDDLVIRVELPGMAPDDLKVTVEDDHLVIRGERQKDEDVERKGYYRMESSYGAFERFIPLPERFDGADIEAGYANGVLEVIVPGITKELERPEPMQIPVRTTSPDMAKEKVA